MSQVADISTTKKYKFNENFIKHYDQNSDKEYMFKVDAKYLKQLHDSCNNPPILPERMKIKKYQKLACNFYDKEKFIALIRKIK